MANITYIFSEGRKDKIDSNQVQAEEFYYGFFGLERLGHKLKIIEFNKNKKLLQLFDKVLNKFLSLPFNTSYLTSIENFKLIKKTEYLFLVNEKVAFSSFFLLLFAKLFNRNLKTTMFAMGLYSKSVRYKYFYFLHNLLIKLLILMIDNIIFLGKSEFQRAKMLNKNNDKFHFIPFGIDTTFWKVNINEKIETRDYVLFVGNDGNRDYELLVQLISHYKDIKFKVVTNNLHLVNFKADNLEFFSGNWNSNNLTDKDLKNLYKRSIAVIIPLKDSFQPSGQSVSLQAMSVGTPVAITRTKGFWEKEKYFHDKNIFFIEGNKLESWKNFFEYTIFNDSLLNKVSIESLITTNKNYTIDSFNQKVYDVVFKDIKRFK